MAIKLLIVDDHRLFREGITTLFDHELIEIAGEAGNGIEAIDVAREIQPDIVLMDIGMDGMNGIEATRIIRNELPDAKVIGLSMHADKNYIKEMLEAGASGYILKNCTHGQLNEAILAVHKGNKYLSDEITDIVISEYLTAGENGAPKKPVLTQRETEILKLYAEGFSTHEIADKLFISVKTVGTHKQNIMKKVSLKSVADMVKYALKNGIVQF